MQNGCKWFNEMVWMEVTDSKSEYSGCCCGEDGRVKPHVNVTKPVLNLPKPDMVRILVQARKSWFVDL